MSGSCFFWPETSKEAHSDPLWEAHSDPLSEVGSSRKRSSVSVEVDLSNACFKTHYLYMSILLFNDAIPNVSAIFSHLEFWNENRKIGINSFSVGQFSQNKINLYYLGHNTPVCNHSVFKKLYLAAILENRPSWPSQKNRIGHNLASN